LLTLDKMEAKQQAKQQGMDDFNFNWKWLELETEGLWLIGTN